MPKIPIACSVCGVPTTNGSRCKQHEKQAFRSPVACIVCGQRSAFSYCDEHRFGDTQENFRRAAAWRAGYRDPLYKKNRQLAIERAGGKCEKCGRSDLPFECDHKIPLSKGGTSHIGNLQILCAVCHKNKTMKRRSL